MGKPFEGCPAVKKTNVVPDNSGISEGIAPVSAGTGESNKDGRRIVEFERQLGVAIVTKIHGPHQLLLLEQSLCLLHHAYNNRPLYDIVVFTAEPLSEEQISTTRNLVAPAKLTVVVDNRGFQNEIAALSPVRRQKFLEACNVTSPANLTWWSMCPGRLAYNWQAGT